MTCLINRTVTISGVRMRVLSAFMSPKQGEPMLHVERLHDGVRMDVDVGDLDN